METTNTQETKINIEALLKLWDAATRRALDIIAAFFGLFFLSPIFLIIAYFIRRDSSGPIFYFGPRAGKNGKTFGIVKFRTMYERQESYQGPRITASGDDRITPFGHWLRDTKVNELPQLWNVLVGDMSLVGPRPEDPEIVKSWPVGLREELLSVRPGITSPATVIFRSEESMLQSNNALDDYLRTILPDKLRLDLLYIRSRSFLTDLDVIFMTLLLLLPKLRKTSVPESSLYWGPLAQFVSRNLNWFCIDTIVAFVAMGVSVMLWRINSPLNLGWGIWIGVSVIVALCFSIINSALGLALIQWRRAPAWEIIPLAFSAACSTFVLIVVDFAVFHKWQIQTGHPHLPLGMLIFTGLLCFLGFSGMRYRERLLTGFASFWLNSRRSSSAMGERVLLIGAGNNSQLATWLLTHSEFSRIFSIVGIVDDDPRKQGLYFDGYRVMGTTRDIPMLMERNQIGLAILTITHMEEYQRQRILRDCRAANSHFVVFPDVMAELADYFQATPGQQRQPFFTVGD